jgi:hypothetical protein
LGRSVPLPSASVGDTSVHTSRHGHANRCRAQTATKGEIVGATSMHTSPQVSARVAKLTCYNNKAEPAEIHWKEELYLISPAQQCNLCFTDPAAAVSEFTRI